MFSSNVTSILNAGARLNKGDALRNGNIISLPGAGDLIVAGDLHNHQRNFERIQTVANLAKNPQRHVILQEIVHGGALNQEGGDWSLEMLLEAIAWAEKFPGQVHFLLANHDLAQVQGQPIMKDGYDLTDRFTRYFKFRAGGDWPAASAAFRSFFMSMPLAAVTFSGILLTHSLPAPKDMATFDNSILRRELLDADYARNGAVYQLIWGRAQTPELLATLSKAWWSDLFICGHQAQDAGYGIIGGKMLILDSSHNHGVYLKIDLSRPYTMEDLVASVKPLASVA